MFFSACSHLIEAERIEDNCTKINIIINDNNVEKKLFNSLLKNSLGEKFNLLLKNSKTTNLSEKLCKLTINVTQSESSALDSESGSASRINKKIKVKYNFSGNNVNLSNTFVIFYGSNRTNYVYSDYIKNKKEDINDIENIANRIYFGIVNRFSK